MAIGTVSDAPSQMSCESLRQCHVRSLPAGMEGPCAGAKAYTRGYRADSVQLDSSMPLSEFRIRTRGKIRSSPV
jgi:hypothetical protein